MSTLAPTAGVSQPLTAPRACSRQAAPAVVLAPPGWYGPTKAALDVALAALILLLAAPVILLAMALVKLTSRGPALYTQTRVGRCT